MKESNELHPLLKDFQIEARQQSICLYAGRQKIPAHLDVKAIYIFGDDTKTAVGHKAYNRVFGSRREDGLPGQRVMKFMPSTSDNRFPITPSRMKDMVKMVAKQKRISDRAKLITTTTLNGIHYLVPEIGLNLCQILMAMRSSQDHKKQLFMAIDERRGSTYSIVFTVHSDRYTEANSIIPVLWVILHAEFGPRAWEWFTDLALQSSQGYEYDPKTGHLTNTEEEESEDDSTDNSSLDSEEDPLVQELQEHLNLSDAPANFHVDIKFVFDETDQATNQYGDSGSVKTMRSTCVKQPYTKDEVKEVEASECEKQAEIHKTNSTTKETNPAEISVDGGSTKATSTLTDYTSNSEEALRKLFQANPELLQNFLSNNPQLENAVANSGDSKPPAKQQTEPPKADPDKLDSDEDE
jgi:hypothetical protein